MYRLAMARDKSVSTILAKANFEKYKSAASFRANDDLLALDPILVLTLDTSLDATARQEGAFGPSQKIGQAARAGGIRVIAVANQKR